MKRLLIILSIFFALSSGAGLVLVQPVAAQDAGLNEVGQTIKLSSTDPRIIATRIINIALGLIGIILVGIIVYAGFLYMTSGGDPEKTGNAKKMIVSAIIGLVIILSAWAIARFVIERLLQATGGGPGTTTGTGGGGLGGGFGGSGTSNVFQVKSITPQGNVTIRNVQIKLLFTRPVDEASATAIVVTKNGGTGVGGTLNVAGSLVTFTPSTDCPAPNEALKCFDAESDYTVQIGPALRSTAGQTIVCGGFAPACTATFHTGSLIDTQPPTVNMTAPLDGQSVPADSLVSLGAWATDDSGVSVVLFTDGGSPIDQVGPSASSTATTFQAEAQWDTAGIPLQSVRQLAATARDIDNHQTQSSAISVVVRSPSCFNGVKDGDETDIDCGGTPNTPGFCGACSGGSCNVNNQCSSGVCSNGTCVEQPIITAMSPQDGQPGTFVTIKGTNFGANGTVMFLGGPGPGDDISASAPAACSATNSWSPTQVIVAVPAAAAIGPIRLTNASSNLSDESNDTRGPTLPDFVVNDKVYPGLCGVQPASGFVGDQFELRGQNFGTNPSSVTFGPSTITSFSAWADDQLKTNVPVVGVGKHTLRVNVGGVSSNAVDFQVLNKATVGPPTIAELDPAEGPKGEYVTLRGTNFGFNVGTVRFKQKISGQEALADTAFPAACGVGFWSEDRVVVKVPQQLLVGGSVTPGDYSVRLIRSDNAASNERDFVVNGETPKPGICAVLPTVGPVGTSVTIAGERFGASNQSVTFHNGKSAIATSWTNTEIKTSVPVGAVTGPVRVTVQGTPSNGVNFEVRNCNEQPGICSQSEQCCANGSCVPQGQSCGALLQKAMFAWQSSTGLIPVAPRVVEECAPNQVPAPLPSPSPWSNRAGGDQVCVSATVSMRFTTHLDAVTVSKSNFRLKKCTSASNEPCATTEEVSLASGFPALQAVSPDQDAVFMQPQSDLETSTTYLVEVMTGVKGAGQAGDTMAPRPECGPGVAYCFRFKTRASSAACAVGGVSVVPHPYELNDAGATVNYQASPLSSEDKCVILKCDAFDWEWEHGDGNADGRAIFQSPLALTSNGKTSCKQVGVAVTETGNVPVNMSAIVKPDNVKGTAHLYVKFLPPRVEDFAPDCQLVCTNALLWARFNTAIDIASIAGNVEVRPCANENCVVAELGAPLPIPESSISLTPPFKSTETTLRLLRIEPVKPGVNPGTKDLLLQPGKYYRVLLRGGTSQGIRGLNGVPMTGLNDPEGFVWTFRTKLGDAAFCTALGVDVSPLEKYETVVGARQSFLATAYGEADECSAAGQTLVQTSSANWASSRPEVAVYVGGATLDTGGALPAQCSTACLAMGSQAEFGKVAVCGNGLIETTDANYCKNGQTPFADGCVVLPAGAKAGEQCDPGVASNVGLCDAASCLWKPIAQLPNGSCGNGTIEQGEACDFGRFCMGAAASSTTPDMTPCTSNADQASCEANGGTCAARQYRGCSPFCRHTGSTSAGSTCGNSDVADGEDCDDGNLTNGDGCSSSCLHQGSTPSVVSVCGNAQLEPGETCEKVNANDPSFPAGCLPKVCLHTGTAQCDNDPNTPNVNCCGNAQTDAGEDCDDGNKIGKDGCSASCLLEGSSAGYLAPSFCSDGVVGTGEQCEAAAGGDGIVDALQLAEIVGNAEPDPDGLMSSKLSAALEGKTGEATYGLRCGFTDEASCPAGYGLTDNGCCQARPVISGSYPSGSGVCRNTEISATFNVGMNAASVVGNVHIAKQENAATCPAGTQQVADDLSPVTPGRFAWLRYAWRRVVAWWTGNPAIAAIWCAGSVTGSWTPQPADPTRFVFKLDSALEPNTVYRVKFLGDDSTTPDALADNAALAQKKGVKTVKGVVAPFDSSAENGPLTFSFQTGGDICRVNLVQIEDLSTEHPLLFVKGGEQHPFTATALSLQNGTAVKISQVAEYSWQWLPWTTSRADIVNVVNPQPNQTNATIEAENKNGNAFVAAWLAINNDSVNVPSTTGSVIQGTAPVSVALCENPWPSLQTAPFRDKKPTGIGNDSSLVGTIFENGPYFNFSTMYCRDAGVFGTTDDIPELQINFVPPTTTDKIEGILRQYLFTYGPDRPELKKDGIGIRVVANPLHLSPDDWYASRGFGGTPQVVEVDGYRALKDGTTTYVAAANTENPGKKIYSNIYLISHNPDASPVTLSIYNQMVETLAFNINLTQGVANVCEEGNDPNVEPAPPFLTSNFETVACSSDYECLKLGDNYHCGSYKLKLARDTVRVADFQAMSREIEEAKVKNGTYPKLTAGTFLQGLTTSRWPSWDAELQSTLGQTVPKDPVNQFLTCGRCSQSQSVCGRTEDCPKGESCVGVTFQNGSFFTSTSTEAVTCWDTEQRRFFCPRIGASPSRIYQYRSLNGGARYELGSEFEVPESDVPGAEWWEPPLMSEVQRCTNAETFGSLCDVDADCRPCANPKDMVGCPVNQFPIVNGACRAVGGRFTYKDICTNIAYGQSGTCGDGVIGQACLGGSNNGNACTQNGDCPGGSCEAAELCEVGQTKLADCTTSGGQAGLKLQVCNECKEFVDDVNVSACNAGVMCGNGKIDKKCAGGVRNNLACVTDADCAGNANVPAGVCGPSGETCDDGFLNGTYGHCNTSCNGYAGFCGDGQISPGEVCDNGPANGEYCGIACNVSQSCSLDCKSKAPYCGDAIITAPEQCDGQTQTTMLAICLSGPGQGQPCSTNADCGEAGACAAGNDPLASCQGKTQNRCATALKQCVTPSLNSCVGYEPGAHKTCQTDADCAGQPGGQTACRSLQDFCFDCSSDAQCSTPGVPGSCNALPTQHVRTCNSGNADQCTYTGWSSCKIVGFCGDGKIDAPGEECDNASENGDTKACTASCKKNVCGDGKPYVGIEECDAGGQNGTITCSADYNSTCASCSTQCKFLSSAGGYCGDTVKNGPEQCDGMNSVPNLAEGEQPLSEQFPNCPSPGKPNEVCAYVNADCLQSPCQKTREVGITCQSLGYDFAVNGLHPKLYAIDPALDVLDSSNICPQLQQMKKYEIVAYQACLGMQCPYCGPNNNDLCVTAAKFANPLPSVNDFWKCVREKGPALGVGVKTDANPELVQCTNSCGFGGCGRCSDEIGSGAISGQLVDAVYNQVIPQARISLFYKGALVKQVASDDDGKFTVTGLNDRLECSQYKIVVDMYNDNPCTGSGEGRPNCGLPAAPDWTYATVVDEGARGGYWPYTSKTFTAATFKTVVSPANASSNEPARIYLFPRPAAGEAYFSVLWDVDWSGQSGVILGMHNNHLILPKSHAYTAPFYADSLNEGYPQNYTPATCNYDQRPTASGRQCVRDVTSRFDTRGYADLTKLPYAQLICLHRAGEKVGGGANSPWNGCPVEGYDKCLAAKGGVDPNNECTNGQPENCEREWWDTCDFYKQGPLTTYFRYSAFAGSIEPMRMFWGWVNKSVHPVLNGADPNGLKKFLNDRKFRAVISTDSQIIELSAADISSGNSTCGKDCKFWHLGDLNPTDGSVTVKNRLAKQRVGSPEFTEGMAIYQLDFQGAYWDDQNNDGKGDFKYCMSGDTLYKRCNTGSDCPAGTGTCQNPTYQQWSRASY